jgi:High-affinity nitrate transporter accessory
MINYAVNTTTPANATSTINLKACFGPQSSANRAWRKPNPVIVDDKSCSTKITTGLPPTGNFTYTVTTRLAPAVYRIQALEICPGNVACSMGASAAYFQTYTIDATPGWLMAMAGCFAALGPLSLVAFFVWEQYMKKRQ